MSSALWKLLCIISKPPHITQTLAKGETHREKEREWVRRSNAKEAAKQQRTTGITTAQNVSNKRSGRKWTARLKAKMEERKNLLKKSATISECARARQSTNVERETLKPTSLFFECIHTNTRSLEGFHQFHQPKPCYISMHVPWFLLFISCNRIPLLLLDLLLFCLTGREKERNFFFRAIFLNVWLS